MNNNRLKRHQSNISSLSHRETIKSNKSGPEVASGSRVSDASVARMAEEKTDQVAAITNTTLLYTGAEQQCQDEPNAEHDVAQDKSDTRSLSDADTERQYSGEPESTLSDDIAGNSVLALAKEMPDQLAVMPKDNSSGAEIDAEQRCDEFNAEVTALDGSGDSLLAPAEENLNQLPIVQKNNSSNTDVDAEQQYQENAKIKVDADNIVSPINRIYSYDEAHEKLEKILETVSGLGGSTDDLILKIYDFQLGHGLKVMNLTGWNQFFKEYLKQSSYSQSSLYHCAEIAEYAIQQGVRPTPITNKSFRAICKVKQQDRPIIWQKAVQKSNEDIPPPEIINEVIKEAKKAGSNELVDKIFTSLTLDKTLAEIQEARYKIVKRLENIESDKYELQELSAAALKKLKTRFDNYLIHHSTSFNN